MIELNLGLNTFEFILNNLNFLLVIFEGVFVFFISFFIEKNGKSSEFLNLYSALCLLSVLVLSNLTQEIYWNNAFTYFNETSLYRENFYIYMLIIFIIFLFGIADRFFIGNSSDSEFTILIYIFFIGAVILLFVPSLLEFFLALEIITLGSYVLTAYDRVNRFSAYSGVQYFILGSIPSGLLILSIALLYKTWGTFVFNEIFTLLVVPLKNGTGYTYIEPLNSALISVSNEINAQFNVGYTISETLYNINYNNNLELIWGLTDEYSLVTVFAIILIMYNLLFKLTAAPFHFWAPSVYGGAPLSSVTFLSIFSKALVLFILLKMVIVVFWSYKLFIISFLLPLGVLTVIVGMIGAFSEKIVKRFFVYSSMGHVGFMLSAFSLSTLNGISATFHYLPVYIVTSFIMWFVLLHMGPSFTQLTHFSSLRRTNILLTLIFSAIIFSMSGIPPLGGFFVKFDVLSALVNASRFFINAILLLSTVITFYYYVRVIKIMFFDKVHKYSLIKKRKVSGFFAGRLWLIIFLTNMLATYILFVEKPLLWLQNESFLTLLS